MDIENIIENIQNGVNSIEKYVNKFEHDDKENYFYMINNIEVLINHAKNTNDHTEKEDTKNIIFIFTFYHKELIEKLFTDNAKGNDFDKIRQLEELAKEYLNSNFEDENEDLEDTTKAFLEHQIELNEFKNELFESYENHVIKCMNESGLLQINEYIESFLCYFDFNLRYNDNDDDLLKLEKLFNTKVIENIIKNIKILLCQHEQIALYN